MELREKIAAIVHRHKLKGADAVAKMILELPEIAEALKLTAKVRLGMLKGCDVVFTNDELKQTISANGNASD